MFITPQLLKEEEEAGIRIQRRRRIKSGTEYDTKSKEDTRINAKRQLESPEEREKKKKKLEEEIERKKRNF